MLIYLFILFKIHTEFSSFIFITTLSDIEVLIEAHIKPEEEELDESNPDAVPPEDLWEDSGLENISSSDFSSTGNSLLGTYIGHSTRPYPEPRAAFLKEILTFSGTGGVSLSGVSLLNDT